MTPPEIRRALPGHPFTLLLGLILAASVCRADTRSRMTIVRGAISRDQQSVELRMRDGQTLRRLNREDFGFNGIHISPDHRTASWNVLYNLGSAHFIYPVSTGVEVWRPGAQLDRIIYCDDAVLSHWWFWAGGRQVVLDCGTAHGPASERHLLFDVTSGKQLGEVRYDDRTRTPIGPEAGWSILQTRMGDGPAAR